MSNDSGASKETSGVRRRRRHSTRHSHRSLFSETFYKKRNQDCHTINSKLKQRVFRDGIWQRFLECKILDEKSPDQQPIATIKEKISHDRTIRKARLRLNKYVLVEQKND
ncbi:hypothetical protein YC2023_037218 [Brassica napus]